ncbi:hypothetical protein MXB_1823, partial [Myxobolus squamalis]
KNVDLDSKLNQTQDLLNSLIAEFSNTYLDFKQTSVSNKIEESSKNIESVFDEFKKYIDRMETILSHHELDSNKKIFLHKMREHRNSFNDYSAEFKKIKEYAMKSHIKPSDIIMENKASPCSQIDNIYAQTSERLNSFFYCFK